MVRLVPLEPGPRLFCGVQVEAGLPPRLLTLLWHNAEGRNKPVRTRVW